MSMAGDYCAGQHYSGEPLSLRPQQAAAWLGVSVSTLNRLTRTGKIPRLTVGRIVLYRVKTLRNWLENTEMSEDGRPPIQR
jgi:excisionase family DNA binding protein